MWEDMATRNSSDDWIVCSIIGSQSARADLAAILCYIYSPPQNLPSARNKLEKPLSSPALSPHIRIQLLRHPRLPSPCTAFQQPADPTGLERPTRRELFRAWSCSWMWQGKDVRRGAQRGTLSSQSTTTRSVGIYLGTLGRVRNANCRPPKYFPTLSPSKPRSRTSTGLRWHMSRDCLRSCSHTATGREAREIYGRTSRR